MPKKFFSNRPTPICQIYYFRHWKVNSKELKFKQNLDDLFVLLNSEHAIY